MRFRLGKLAWLLVLAGVPSLAFAGSCKQFLVPDPPGVFPPHSFSLTLVTLNTNGVASYANGYMEHRTTGRRPDLATFGGDWWGTTGWLGPGTNGAIGQLFSDRFGANQPFSIAKNDLIYVAITNEDSPKVTMTLRSWGNVKISFVGTCTEDGIMHGDAGETSFMLILRRSKCSGSCGGGGF